MEIPPGARIYDLSLPISPDLPVWPGDPAVAVEPVTRIAAGDAFNVSRLTLSSHAGTHVDAQWHALENGARLDDLPIERFIGPCHVVGIPAGPPLIEPDHLEAAAIPPGTERLLLRTANSARWRSGDLRFDEDYVALSPAAARWVVACGVRLVGIDALSIEPFADEAHEVHRTLLAHDVLILEALNLSAVVPGPSTLLCLPLRLTVGDGAPARALLIQSPAPDEGYSPPES